MIGYPSGQGGAILPAWITRYVLQENSVLFPIAGFHMTSLNFKLQNY